MLIWRARIKTYLYWLNEAEASTTLTQLPQLCPNFGRVPRTLARSQGPAARIREPSATGKQQQFNSSDRRRASGRVSCGRRAPPPVAAAGQGSMLISVTSRERLHFAWAQRKDCVPSLSCPYPCRSVAGNLVVIRTTTKCTIAYRKLIYAALKVFQQRWNRIWNPFYSGRPTIKMPNFPIVESCFSQTHAALVSSIEV